MKIFIIMYRVHRISDSQRHYETSNAAANIKLFEKASVVGYQNTSQLIWQDTVNSLLCIDKIII